MLVDIIQNPILRGLAKLGEKASTSYRFIRLEDRKKRDLTKPNHTVPNLLRKWLFLFQVAEGQGDFFSLSLLLDHLHSSSGLHATTGHIVLGYTKQHAVSGTAEP